MKEKLDIKVIKNAGLLLIVTLLLLVLWYTIKSHNTEVAGYFLGFAIIAFAAAWIITFIDIKNHRVYNKQFWAVSMFVLPYITIFVYLIRRNKLIRFGKKHAWN